MNRANRSYVIGVAAVSMLLMLSYIYVGFNQHNCLQTGAKSVLKLTGLFTEECEKDDFVDMTEYLETRRNCILRYCGDVCQTKRESDESKNRQKFVLIHIFIFV